MSRAPGGRRRRLAWAAVLVVVLGLAGGAVAVLTREPGDVSHPDVEFNTAPPAAPTTTQPASAAPDAKDPFDDGFTWPTYGLTPARTRYLPLNRPLRPPFVERWVVGGSTLLEFPPVLCGKSLYLLKNNGALYAISRRTGDVRWKLKLGHLAAASPACGDGSVYAVLLERDRSTNAGRVVALSGWSGRKRWSRPLPSRAESSPLLDHERLYFGSEDGTVYSLRADNGSVVWTYRAGGAVKGGLALDGDGRLIFGDYDGEVTALRRADGSRIWRTGTSAGAFGLRSGNFYSTPAIAFGRVYIGSTNGFVYSFAARTGALAWRHRTGGYVYSSPAVSPLLGGTVYAGSYDGKLYAFDARSGAVRWTHDAGGRLSGGPVVIGDLVFYSNLGRKTTGAVGAATGTTVWSFRTGAFNPVISDGTRLYLVGYSSLYMLTEQGRRTDGTLTTQAQAKRKAAQTAAAKKRRLRYLNARIRQRRAEVSRILRLRREGTKVCFKNTDGKPVCRVPRPPVCFKRETDGRTICRARKPS